MASPALRRQLPRLLLGADPSFRIEPQASLEMLRWSVDFLRNTKGARFAENTLAVLALSLESRAAMSEFLEANSIEFSHRRVPKAHLYGSVTALRKAEKIVRLKEGHGLRQEVLSAREVLDREPSLRTYGGAIAGAVWSPDEEVGDCHAFCVRLADILRSNYGVEFRFGERIEALQCERNGLVALRTTASEMPARRCVVALGAGAPAVLKTAGIHSGIWPVQGYSVTLPASDATPRISITDTARKLVICRLGNSVRIAGLADIGAGLKFRQERLQVLLHAARSAFPKAADYSAPPNAWTGARPMTPTSQPKIGRSPVGGVFLNCGHGMLGWTLAMGSAERLASVAS
jgi:D-amino-acid dehydrogenase